MLKGSLLSTARVHICIPGQRTAMNAQMNIARIWNPKNRSRLRRREDLPGTEKMRKDAATLWYVQVDAAARDEAEVDGGGGAAKLAT